MSILWSAESVTAVDKTRLPSPVAELLLLSVCRPLQVLELLRLSGRSCMHGRDPEMNDGTTDCNRRTLIHRSLCCGHTGPTRSGLDTLLHCTIKQKYKNCSTSLEIPLPSRHTNRWRPLPLPLQPLPRAWQRSRANPTHRLSSSDRRRW